MNAVRNKLSVEGDYVPKQLKDHFMTQSEVIVGDRQDRVHTANYPKKHLTLAKHMEYFQHSKDIINKIMG